MAERKDRPSGSSRQGWPAVLAPGSRTPARKSTVRRHVGALHAHDRLLLVADHEQGAPQRPRALAGEELGAQRLDDRPLLGAGILAFVDQKMIDLLVELVLHPRRHTGPLEQAPAAGDQIVEIERGGVAFAPVVGVQHGRADAQQRRGALRDPGRLLALDPANEARLLGGNGGSRSPGRPRRRHLEITSLCLGCRSLVRNTRS